MRMTRSLSFCLRLASVTLLRLTHAVCAGCPSSGKLYHYTSSAGYHGILQEGKITAGPATQGKGVYSTHLQPSRGKVAILQNNYRRGAAGKWDRADYVFEIDCEALQRDGKVVRNTRYGEYIIESDVEKSYFLCSGSFEEVGQFVDNDAVASSAFEILFGSEATAALAAFSFEALGPLDVLVVGLPLLNLFAEGFCNKYQLHEDAMIRQLGLSGMLRQMNSALWESCSKISTHADLVRRTFLERANVGKICADHPEIRTCGSVSHPVLCFEISDQWSEAAQVDIDAGFLGLTMLGDQIKLLTHEFPTPEPTHVPTPRPTHSPTPEPTHVPTPEPTPRPPWDSLSDTSKLERTISDFKSFYCGTDEMRMRSTFSGLANAPLPEMQRASVRETVGSHNGFCVSVMLTLAVLGSLVMFVWLRTYGRSCGERTKPVLEQAFLGHSI